MQNMMKMKQMETVKKTRRILARTRMRMDATPGQVKDDDKEEDEMTMRKSLRSKRKMKSMNSMQVRIMIKKRK